MRKSTSGGCDLSIVILTYNVKELLKNCLDSIFSDALSSKWQVIVVDNASSDGTEQMIRRHFVSRVEYIISPKNWGFAKGNNLARPLVRAKTVLFLNPDTRIIKNAISDCWRFLQDHNQYAALSCRVELPDGRMDYSCHRGLPTVWNTFCYWSGLSRLCPKNKLFSGYTASWGDTGSIHEIECASGTFVMIRADILDRIGWWDEDYYWNGEDIEFFWQLKKHGGRLLYYPDARIVHYKGSSSGLWKTGRGRVDEATKIIAAKSAARAMRIFVSKHRSELGGQPWVSLVYLGIYMIEKYRLIKLQFRGAYAK